MPRKITVHKVKVKRVCAIITVFTECNSSCSEFLFMNLQVDILKVPQNSENKPLGLYFSKDLFQCLIFGGAYLWREICVSKSIGLVLWLEGNLLILLCFTLYLRAISKCKPPGGLYLAG